MGNKNSILSQTNMPGDQIVFPVPYSYIFYISEFFSSIHIDKMILELLRLFKKER